MERAALTDYVCCVCLCLALAEQRTAGAQTMSFPSLSNAPQAASRQELDDLGFIYEANSSRGCIEAAKDFLLKYEKSEFAEFARAAAMRSYVDLDNWDEANRMAESILATNPSNVDGLTTLAYLLIDSDHESEATIARAKRLATLAVQELQRKTIPRFATGSQWILTKKSFLALATFVLGWSAYREGEATDALRLIEKAIALDPQGEYLYRLSLLNESAGDLDSALRAAKQAQQIGPAKIGRLALRQIALIQKMQKAKP